MGNILEEDKMQKDIAKLFGTENDKKEKKEEEKALDGCRDKDVREERITERSRGGGWLRWALLILRHLLSLCEEKAFQVLIKTFTVLSKQKAQGEAQIGLPRSPGALYHGEG